MEVPFSCSYQLFIGKRQPGIGQELGICCVNVYIGSMVIQLGFLLKKKTMMMMKITVQYPSRMASNIKV